MLRCEQYPITRTEDERAALSQRVSSVRGAARELARARILLKADDASTGTPWTEDAIAQTLELGRSTIERVSRPFVEQGVEAAIAGRAPVASTARG
jgi:hypothetical protein